MRGLLSLCRRRRSLRELGPATAREDGSKRGDLLGHRDGGYGALPAGGSGGWRRGGAGAGGGGRRGASRPGGAARAAGGVPVRVMVGPASLPVFTETPEWLANRLSVGVER